MHSLLFLSVFNSCRAKADLKNETDPFRRKVHACVVFSACEHVSYGMAFRRKVHACMVFSVCEHVSYGILTHSGERYMHVWCLVYVSM